MILAADLVLTLSAALPSLQLNDVRYLSNEFVYSICAAQRIRDMKASLDRLDCTHSNTPADNAKMLQAHIQVELSGIDEDFGVMMYARSEKIVDDAQLKALGISAGAPKA